MNYEPLLSDFEFPEEYERFRNTGINNFEVWTLLNIDEIHSRFEGLKLRYPNQGYIPFAERSDNDDLAVWKINEPSKVYLVHDYASQGYELRKTYETFWDWVRDAVNDMIEFMEC